MVELTEAQATQLHRLVSPHIEGDTLFIDGEIDSHIYDFLAREAIALKAVHYVELNSLGGNNDWGLEAATKLKSMGVTTRLAAGKFCASACSFLFAAGKVRQAVRGTWIGLHGARLGAGYTTSFQGLCFVELQDSGSQFMPKLKGCQDFLNHWYDLSLKATNEAFTFMESNGVLPSLRATYFAMPDDPDWPDQLNVVRKPNWPLAAEDALGYGLVTELL